MFITYKQSHISLDAQVRIIQNIKALKLNYTNTKVYCVDAYARLCQKSKSWLPDWYHRITWLPDWYHRITAKTVHRLLSVNTEMYPLPLHQQITLQTSSFLLDNISKVNEMFFHWLECLLVSCG